jgi:nitrite reductase/ring-hydroxylating ferredoxin subunit
VDKMVFTIEACSRREFLRGAGCFAGALALAGIPAHALANPPVFVEGGQIGDDKTYPIPAADGVTVDRTAQVIIVRANGHVYAFALSCPHQNAAVKWDTKLNQFVCTKHDSHYQADGLHTAGRATRNMDRFPIRREGNTLHVDTAHVFQSDKDPAGWAAATVTV